MRLGDKDPLAVELTAAIRSGDLVAVKRLLDAHPGLAAVRIEGEKGGSCTPLLVAADWPGFFPNGGAMVRLLIAAGADPNARTGGEGLGESPLHWAASSDDAEVAEALIQGGADMDAPDGSIGTPLANAVGYGCWQVADLLIGRGARVGSLWEAAALGKMTDIEARFAAEPGPGAEEINHAFWQACHGGQPRAAAYLLDRGAALGWMPAYAKEPALAAAKGRGTRWGLMESWLRDHGATDM